MSEVGFIFFILIGAVHAQSLSDLEQGAYLVKIAGCADCHTANDNQPMAGGYRLHTKFGDFYTPNITPDRKTGIGLWTEEQFRNALRGGVSPEGRIYYPAFPYRSFSKISDDDINKIFLYLRSLRPIAKKNRAHQLDFPYDYRWLMHFWKWMFFDRKRSNIDDNIKVGVGPFRPDEKKSASWNRGAYLVEALAHCAECHTPRNSFGNVELDEWMAGNADVLEGRPVPNITPDVETGLGKWTKEDWLRFLTSGYTPEFSTPSAEMADVIQNTSALTKEDREAMVEYLMSLTPVNSDTGHKSEAEWKRSSLSSSP